MSTIALGVAAVGGYLAAVRLYGLRYPNRTFAVGRVVAFCAGVAVAVAALSPPMDMVVDRSFAAHMVQHLILALVVPPLLLLGAPLTLAVALPPPRAGKAIARIARHRIARAATSPVSCWVIFVVVLWGIHFSVLYELALRYEGVHVFEHALLLGAALLFWMPIVHVGYAAHPVPFPVRLFYLIAAIPQGAFLGLAIYSARDLLYPHYAIGRSLSAALSDQQDAGAIMWIGGGALMFTAFMLTAATWAAREHRAEAIA
ncbi:MAG: cytochrome c oxidase assembly protein [Candidatus Aquilonibacter sp.]